MDLHVGTSGFSYDEWRPSFYPRELKKAAMLGYYAARLPAVELNHTFYRMPTAKQAQQWRAQVPAGFRFAVKASQRLTWSHKLVGCGDLLAELGAALAPLDEALGCVFYQVPKWVPKDLAVLRAFLAAPQPCRRIAFEFAHPGWHEPDALQVLREHNAALVASDKDDAPPPELAATADWAYLRLRRTAYGDDELRQWRRRLAADGRRAAFVFFRHEDTGTGPAFAARFLALGAD